MTPAQWQRVKEVVETALEREPEQRPGFLREVCGSDEALRSEAESLLAEQDRVGSFLKSFAVSAHRSLAGTEILHYKIIEKLGEGGMGVVYKARDTRLNRFVALKLLPPEITAGPDNGALVRMRLLEEARMAGSLSHSNIATVFDVGEWSGTIFMTQELARGRDLKKIIAESGPLPLRRTIAIVRQICEGLAHAHARGIVHRDIKPANIVVDPEDRVKITDFGLAQRPPDKHSSIDKVVAGTPGYMAPEQMLDGRVDARADQFSVGCILYEMLTGRPAFPDETIVGIIEKTLHFSPPAPSQVRSDLPRAIDRLIARAMRKASDERYDNINLLAQDLVNYEQFEWLTDCDQAVKEIINALDARNCLVIMGLHLRVSGGKGRSSTSDRLIADHLAEHVEVRPDGYGLSRIAHELEIERGRAEMTRQLIIASRDPGISPTEVLRQMAKVAFPVIVTTRHDTFLEEEFARNGRKLRVLDCRHVPDELSGGDLLVRLFGSVEDDKSIVVTENDLWEFLGTFQSLSDSLKSFLAQKNILFVGYDPATEEFRHFLSQIMSFRAGTSGGCFLVMEDTSLPVVRWSRNKDLHIVEANSAEFLSLLAEAMADRRRQHASLPFEASSPMEIMHQILYTEPETTHAANPLLPVAVDGVLQRALSKDPELSSRLPESVVTTAKPQTQGGHHASAAPVGASPLVPAGKFTWLKSRKVLFSAAIGACVAALALALFLARTRTPAKHAAVESVSSKEAAALDSRPSGPPIAAPIVAGRHPVAAPTKGPTSDAARPSGTSSPAPGAPLTSSGTVAFKMDNSEANWAVAANISGTVAYEGRFLKVVVSSCVLNRPATFTSPYNIEAIAAGVNRSTGETAGARYTQRQSDYHPIPLSLTPGQTIELPPFILKIPIDNFEVKAGDWLTFIIRNKEMSYVYVDWHSLAPPAVGPYGDPATVQAASPVKTASPPPTSDRPLSANSRGAEVKHAMGLRLLDQQKLAEAIAAFTEAISLNADFAEAYLDRCRAYVQVPSLRDRAIPDCNRAIELKPAYPEAHLWRGHAESVSAPDRSVEDFTAAIRLNPEFYDAYVDRSIYYSVHKRPDLAILDLTQAIRVRPTYYYPYYVRGLRFADQKDYGNAIRDFNESIRLQSWAPTYKARGDAYRMQQQFEHAIEDYDETIRLSPNADSYAARAAAKDSLGDKAGAAADRQRAQDLKSATTKAQPSTTPASATDSSPTADARAAEVKHAQGRQMLDQRKYAEAISTLTEAIRLKPDFADAYFDRCRTYGRLTQPSMISHSIEDCDKAIQLKPNFALAYYYRGRAYAAQDQFQRAMKDYDEALRLGGGFESLYTDRGFLHARQNEPDLAIKDYTELIRIKPNDPYSYFARAREYNRQHRPELAIPDCNESIRLDPKYRWAYSARGDAYRLQGKYDLAIQDYDETIRLDPNWADAYTSRAAAKEALGDKAGATADRQRAQESGSRVSSPGHEE